MSTVASMKSLASPIRSSGIGGGYDLFGLKLPQHHLSAAALQAVDVEATMQKLEFEVKFAKEELAEEFDNTLADLEDEAHEDATRKRKKAAVLLHMMGEEKKRDTYEHTLTYVCGTADEEERKVVKRDIRKLTLLINELKVAASDEGLLGAQAVQSPIQIPMQQVYPYRAVKVTKLDLSRFNGDIINFKGFNTKFDSVIRSSGIPEEFWGTYLYERTTTTTAHDHLGR